MPTNRRPLLTLSIPTYNRVGSLRLLVDAVLRQSRSPGVLGEKLEILICNNASTDGTSAYLDGLAKLEGVRVIHHPVNRGAVANGLFCCQEPFSKYVWIMGDDDVPLDGAIPAVLESLERDQPDLLYLPARWVDGDLTDHARGTLGQANLVPLTSLGLGMRASVHVTFISSWVFNMEAYGIYARPPALDRYRDTVFPQLEWTLTLLRHGRVFLAATDAWLIARPGSSGGYAVFDAFANQYNQIIREKLGDQTQLQRFFRGAMLLCYMPRLVWGVRRQTIGNFGPFDKSAVMRTLQQEYGNDRFFRWVLAPIVKLDVPAAWCFRVVAWAMWKAWAARFRREDGGVAGEA